MGYIFDMIANSLKNDLKINQTGRNALFIALSGAIQTTQSSKDDQPGQKQEEKGACAKLNQSVKNHFFGGKGPIKYDPRRKNGFDKIMTGNPFCQGFIIVVIIAMIIM